MQIRVKVSVGLFYFTYGLSGVFGSILVHHAVLYRSFTFGVCYTSFPPLPFKQFLLRHSLSI